MHKKAPAHTGVFFNSNMKPKCKQREEMSILSLRSTILARLRRAQLLTEISSLFLLNY